MLSLRSDRFWKWPAVQDMTAITMAPAKADHFAFRKLPKNFTLRTIQRIVQNPDAA